MVKMTFTEIKELSEMGFTPEQIMTLSAGTSQPVVNEAEAGTSQPAEAEQVTMDDILNPEPTEPDQEKQENQEIAALKDQLTHTQKQLSELVRQMQQNNLKTASVNIMPEDDLERRTDEAMAELIRPTIKKEGENK